MLSGSGIVPACWMPGDRFVPYTLISMPGAKLTLPDAAFETPPITTLDEPPTT